MMNNKLEKYHWIELAAMTADGKMARGEYVRIDDTNAINAWREKFTNRDVFTSVCSYAKPNHTSEFIVPVFFDIDCPTDLKAAQESTLTLCIMLMDRISVPQESLDIYFSGNKGFHVLVPCKVFDAFYSPHILTLYKAMAQKAQQYGVHFIDNTVYTNRRIWRMANSINTKSGLFKIPFTFEELRDMGITSIQDLARSPRPEDSFAISKTFVQTAQWYNKIINYFENQSEKSQDPSKKINQEFKNGWRILPCIKEIQQTTLTDGSRHHIYMILARYYSYLNMHHDEILERIERLDTRNPIRDADYIERIVKFGLRYPGFSGCNDPQLQKYCDNRNCFYAKIKKRDG
ncbi:MAG: hypothetical protein K9M75_05600 [Phycisphaerae bacterium]|nr:hypothetical protein [Phycisphaerae bacterium]